MAWCGTASEVAFEVSRDVRSANCSALRCVVPPSTYRFDVSFDTAACRGRYGGSRESPSRWTLK